ncbi:FAD-binding oxidoreductase [Hydrogenophaga sp.]|uniref:NAD(P)/FAD-dependent oxidoreductase n=1 Tax=Hydrogenophaga sp. TaxID=1904254 RepID=UPI00271C0658|nr:FAD-binding oxidoreductase [Hydrogenophaga sp.]MDO9250115.1 FAD-binding oxidoreductase [Hydrogenophaga sp.]MDP3326533.1 FAD-binding oxidoreductase [Hydrogenophaga sp.]MDP3883985.1 FAD-binding oxidoreductase [Hydrogenophaga sp.]MDZ4357166.1 FAD-binding oxidoreductase [Variovorax sp.]
MTQARRGQQVVVLGAGMVGIACALSLRQRGLEVIVIDPLGPGAATSHGNAGVLARSSLMPFNHPRLWSQLPGLLRGRSPGFRYSPLAMLGQWRWGLAFLSHAREQAFRETTTALDALIRHSGELHRRWMDAAGVAQRRRDEGWLFLYRSEAGYESGAFGRETLARFGVATATLDPHELHDLEPHLQPIFRKALWVKDASSVDSPGEIVRAYARWLVELGGQVVTSEATRLRRDSEDWSISTSDGSTLRADHVVLALGPWSRDFLQQQFSLKLPMGFERGYHRHFSPAQGATLNRPVYDTTAGYVLAPMVQGLRLTTGVELNAQQAPPRLAQLDAAERAAREALALGERTAEPDWLGSRPTLPDSRPMVGECPGQPGVWLALGHQHIGFSTGPGTGELLAQLMLGEPTTIDSSPFRPGRFLRD